MNRVFIRMIETARDSTINYIITSFNAKYILAYQIITTNPLDIAFSILTLKFGLSKYTVLLIIAFLA
jgi:hypothetical protein